MTKFFKFLNSPPALMTLVIVGLTYDLFLLGRAYDLNKGEWASWVQAVGSITALAVAIFVMSRQNAHAVKLVADADRLAALRRADAVYALVQRAHRAFNNIGNTVLDFSRVPGDHALMSRKFKVGAEILTDSREVFKSLPLYELGSFDIVDSVRKLIDALGGYIKALEILRDEPNLITTQSVHPSFAMHHSLIEEALAQFEQGLESLRKNS